MKIFLVWNGARTEGFFTTEKQVAYEARKGSDTNCFYADGTQSHLAQAFCDITVDDACMMEEIDVPRYPEGVWKPIPRDLKIDHADMVIVRRPAGRGGYGIELAYKSVGNGWRIGSGGRGIESYAEWCEVPV